MRNLKFPLMFTASMLCLAMLAGCSSGGGTGQPVAAVDKSAGTVELKLTFPALGRIASVPKTPGAKTRAFGGNIPLGTKVVKLVVTNTATGAIVASRDVAGPTVATTGNLPSLVTVNFPAIPAGSYKVDATAFPDSRATLHAIATGSATATVQPLVTTNVIVPMSLTLSSLTIDKPTALIYTDIAPRTVVLTAIAVNATGGDLVLPLYWTTSDPGVASLSVSTTDPAQVTITGVANGTSTITVYEPNSETVATSVITVSSD